MTAPGLARDALVPMMRRCPAAARAAGLAALALVARAQGWIGPALPRGR
jgi:hypothetical protein